MDLPNITFIPLCPGEAPGDPELGGWRPLPKQFYAHQKLLTLSLEQVLKVVAFRLHEFQLRQALRIVAHRLAANNSY
jgi:hypothetical protein